MTDGITEVFDAIKNAKRDIAIYGGAFNPITTAHIDICKNLTKYGYEVWLMPAYEHVFHKKMADAQHRLNMCNIISEKYGFKLFDYEIKNKSNGRTYETVKNLTDDHSKCRFHLVIGMDNAADINKWYNYEKLIKEVPFLVISREGYKIKEIEWYNKYPHRVMDFSSPVSSTMVREYIVREGYKGLKKYLDKDIIK